MRCIYCRDDAGPFTCVEHIVPESLGNDKHILPPGKVCDGCNQYFGAKVEQIALNSMPFVVGRITAGVPNKRGKVPSITLAEGVKLEPTGEFDLVRISEGFDKVRIDPFTGRPFLKREANVDRDRAIARMLVKIGIAVMAQEGGDLDPLDPQFDEARRFARAAPRGVIWEYAQGELVEPYKLITEVSKDRLGAPLITHQLYKFEIRTEESGNVSLLFQFRANVFITYLTRRDLGDFIERHRQRIPFPLIARSGGTPG